MLGQRVVFQTYSISSLVKLIGKRDIEGIINSKNEDISIVR